MPVVLDYWDRSRLTATDWRPEDACLYKLVVGACLGD